MANPFENYKFKEANDAFAESKIRLDRLKANLDFVKGDDWQNGAAWVGPKFSGETNLSRDLKAEIEKKYASKGSIRSVVRRKVRGVSGRVPTWLVSSRNAPSDSGANPSAEESALVGDAQKILNEFWKNSRVHKTVKEFVKDFETVGDGVFRLYFVQDDETEFEAITEISKAVRKIHLFKEEPGMGVVVMDKKTLKKASFYRYEKDGNVYIEMCYINDDGLTVFKTLSQNDTKNFTQATFPNSLDRYNRSNGDGASETDGLELPLNEKLLIFQMSGDAMVSSAMRSQQKIVNKALTMMSHNLDMDGFRSRVLLNAMPPGKYEKDESTGREVFVADRNGVEVGAGKIQYINGLPMTERDKDTIKQGFTTPGVFESQPISPQSFIDSADAASDCILEEADQKHIAISGDATASGESREQAREEFKQSLEDTKTDLDDIMGEVFECVLAIVAYLMGQPDRYADLQVTYSSILNPGPISSADRTATVNEGNQRYRSRENVMEMIGITDPDAMKDKIKQEEKENPPEDDPNDP